MNKIFAALIVASTYTMKVLVVGFVGLAIWTVLQVYLQWLAGMALGSFIVGILFPVVFVFALLLDIWGSTEEKTEK